MDTREDVTGAFKASRESIPTSFLLLKRPVIRR